MGTWADKRRDKTAPICTVEVLGGEVALPLHRPNWADAQDYIDRMPTATTEAEAAKQGSAHTDRLQGLVICCPDIEDLDDAYDLQMQCESREFHRLLAIVQVLIVGIRDPVDYVDNGRDAEQEEEPLKKD